MFLKRVWFLIAGMLLLNHTPVLAEPYLRVCKNGVVHYYFNSREPAQPGPEGRTSPPGLRQVIPETAAAVPVANLPVAPESPPATARYLINMLTRLGFYDPPVLPPSAAGPQCVEPPEAISVMPDPRFVVPEPRVIVPKYIPEPRPALSQVQPGSERLKVSNILGYCFPVARPFNFRDTWGDPRSGGRVHRAVDIFAHEGTEVYAVTTGVIQTLATLPGAGITLLMQGHDGRGYGYMHLQGYAPGIVEGKMVRQGELIGYVGTTGTQNCAAHLHLQMYADHSSSRDALINPYDFLVQLCHGLGVSDLNQPKIARTTDSNQSRIARLKAPPIKVKWIQVYRGPWSKTLEGRAVQLSTKHSSILVIRNY